MKTFARIVRRIVTSALLRRLLPLLVAGALVGYYREDLLSAIGAGIFFPFLPALLLTWIIWKRDFPGFLRAWNRVLGILALMAALLGLLSFFQMSEGVLYRNSLGGYGGRMLVAHDYGSQSLSIIIVCGLVLLAIICFAPYLSWRISQRGIQSSVPVFKRIGSETQSTAGALRFWYKEHPVHEMAGDWIKKRLEKKPPQPVFHRPQAQPDNEYTPTTGIARETEVHQEPEERVQAPAAVMAPPRPFVKTDSSASVVQAEPATPQMGLPHLGRWQTPSLTLLHETPEAELSQAEIEKRARKIEDALASYGVEAKVVQMNVGPAVTQFGVEPGWDRKVKDIKLKDREGNTYSKPEEISRTRVKVERIKSLENNLALALAATSIRIEAPIPGTSLVGIEVPNTSMGTVSLREVLESQNFHKLHAKSKLSVALGKATAGEVFAADLAKMPHVLIAGATGSGKTVCLDTIILSLLVFNTPEELRFIMVDPKRVELIAFNGVPHLLAPVVTENERAVDMLKWVEQEMDSRYRRMATAGAQNIERYNKSPKIPKPMPFLAVVVDELADLMMSKCEEVEPLLCRLAQMGRAVGIHLIVATQRPSVDVITGLIKANFPTRISFAVVSQVDSRTILDVIGAEKLLGRGDMLYHSPELARPKRLQGCFVSPEEIERVVNFWRQQAKVQVAEIFATPVEETAGRDPLLEQARRLAQEHKQLSASFLQRQLRIGLGRAEKLMQQLQQEQSKSGTDDAESPQ